MAGFGVLIVSGILSAIFLFFIAVFAAAAAYIMASYVPVSYTHLTLPTNSLV